MLYSKVHKIKTVLLYCLCVKNVSDSLCKIFQKIEVFMSILSLLECNITSVVFIEVNVVLFGGARRYDVIIVFGFQFFVFLRFTVFFLRIEVHTTQNFRQLRDF